MSDLPQMTEWWKVGDVTPTGTIIRVPRQKTISEISYAVLQQANTTYPQTSAPSPIVSHQTGPEISRSISQDGHTTVVYQNGTVVYSPGATVPPPPPLQPAKKKTIYDTLYHNEITQTVLPSFSPLEPGTLAQTRPLSSGERETVYISNGVQYSSVSDGMSTTTNPSKLIPKITLGVRELGASQYKLVSVAPGMTVIAPRDATVFLSSPSSGGSFHQVDKSLGLTVEYDSDIPGTRMTALVIVVPEGSGDSYSPLRPRLNFFYSQRDSFFRNFYRMLPNLSVASGEVSNFLVEKNITFREIEGFSTNIEQLSYPVDRVVLLKGWDLGLNYGQIMKFWHHLIEYELTNWGTLHHDPVGLLPQHGLETTIKLCIELTGVPSSVRLGLMENVIQHAIALGAGRDIIDAAERRVSNFRMLASL